MNTFSPKRAVKFGWSTTLKNRRFLIGVILLGFLIEGLFNILTRSITGQLSPNQFYVRSVFNILGFLVDGVVSLGLVKIALDFVDHGQAKIKDLFWVLRRPGKLLSYLGASFLYVLVIGVLIIPLVTFGLMLALTQTTGMSLPLPEWSVLFILPFALGAVYFGIKYGFYSYPITDHHANAIDSLRISSELTKGIKLIGFGIVLGLINVLGALALVVGLLLTIPTTLLAMAHVYRQLSPKS